MPLSRAERGSFQPRTLGSVLGHTRGHGPQRFGGVNVHQGCVGTTRTEIWRCECSGGPLSWTRAAGLSHSVLAGPCAEAGSREIRSRECCRGRWARLARRPGSASQLRERVREGRVRERVLGIWPCGLSSPSVSGRMASGLSPHGVASICTLGWGSGLSRVEWSAIYPVPAPHLFPTPTGAPCALTPQG